MAYRSFTPGFKGTAGTLLYLKSKYAADASCAAFCGLTPGAYLICAGVPLSAAKKYPWLCLPRVHILQLYFIHFLYLADFTEPDLKVPLFLIYHRLLFCQVENKKGR